MRKMGEDIQLSIITVCYNNQEGLRKTADSIMSQTFRAFEWIVIDGGSSDGTKEYLETLSPQPDQWVSERDGGVYFGMNKGLAMAHGEYVMFLNSGDYFHSPESLQTFLSTPLLADVEYGDLMFVSERDSHLCPFDREVDLCFLAKYSLPHPSSMIRTSVLRELEGYDTNLRIVSDWKAWIEMYLKGCSFAHRPVCLSDFVDGGISSTNPEKCLAEREEAFRELFTAEVMDDYIKKHTSYNISGSDVPLDLFLDILSMREVSLKNQELESQIQEMSQQNNELFHMRELAAARIDELEKKVNTLQKQVKRRNFFNIYYYVSHGWHKVWRKCAI